MIRRALILALALLCIGVSVYGQARPVTGKEDAIRSVRDNMLARKKEFTINMDKDTLTALLEDTDFLNAAASIDEPGTSQDGDYLKANVISWRARWTCNNEGMASLTIWADYRTTQKQEKQLDREIAAAIASLNISNASEYDKIKAIHDYIIEMVSYDQSLSRYTAYNAFADKSAVCLGYAAAAYRMFTDAGIECRIISGFAGTDEHVWNIVKLDGKWYNIDLTWDDPISESGENIISYDYFLKSAEDFADHERASEYSTQEFLDSYMLAKTSYIMN